MNPTKQLILVTFGCLLFAVIMAYCVEWLCNDFAFTPLKPLLAKEVSENGVCHIQIDDKFSVYFEDAPSINDTECILYVDGNKTKYYSFASIHESKYHLVRYLLSDYYGIIGVSKTSHYQPCKIR